MEIDPNLMEEQSQAALDRIANLDIEIDLGGETIEEAMDDDSDN